MKELSFFILLLLHLICVKRIICASDERKHNHNGILKPYNGEQINFVLTFDQQTKLESMLPVVTQERSGTSGRALVIQDIKALPSLVMERLLDLNNYNKMVPRVKKVESYETITFTNGTKQMSAVFDVGAFTFKFKYYLRLTYTPSYGTFTWTLDYNKESDFDDNVGHWQVMPHPTKNGWSRVLYSCELKLYKWIPDFIVNFLTKTALVESTTWIRRESEKIKKQTSKTNNIDGMEVNIGADGETNIHMKPKIINDENDNSNNSNSEDDDGFGQLVSGVYESLENGSIVYRANHHPR